ncbi:MAG: type 2 isopentenyl-diphosphate Delta-isomerase [Candidatus Micrarchaeota archaeon]
MANQTEKRKLSHVEICAAKDVEARGKKAGFSDVELVHNALPECDLEKINISCALFGKKMAAPFIIEAITGGYPEAEKINKELAKAAEATGVAMGLGSQRAMIENQKLSGTYNVRDVAPSIVLLGNIGLVQLKEYSVKQICEALAAVNADALAVHLNALQEAVQPEGNRNFEGCLEALAKLCKEVGGPIIAKETGAGISRDAAVRLERAGVKAIDVGGAGGTSWSGVEFYRGSENAETFWDWGIPTVCSLIEARGAVRVPIIASGGVRSGVDVAKSLALGASYAGAALPFLKLVKKGGAKSVIAEIEKWKLDLKTAMFLAGARNLDELRKASVVVTGKTSEYIHARR